jgi:DNA-binding transcriptional ArsR family regulator
MESAALLVHPIRLRIVHTLTGGRSLTTAALGELLPDIPKATLYRHIALLSEGGILRVVAERRVRGAVERSYQLVRDRPPVDAAAIASSTVDDHRRAFTVAMSTLIAEFDGYLRQEGSSPIDDLVGYQQMALWLTAEELAEFVGALQRVVLPLRDKEPRSGRSRYLFSPVLFPTEVDRSPA